MSMAMMQLVRVTSLTVHKHAWSTSWNLFGFRSKSLILARLTERRSLTSSHALWDKTVDKERNAFREDAFAERAADKRDERIAEEKGFNPSKYNTEEDKELDERLEFREDAAAEHAADVQDMVTAKKHGFDSSSHSNPSEERSQEKRDVNQDSALAENGTSHVNANRRSSASQYPASFVLPNSVPHIERLTKSEAEYRQRLLRLLKSVNLPPFLHAFAYGSGVFSQTSTAKKQPDGTPPMIDMVIAVQNPAHWHARNMVVNPTHYPWWMRWAPWWVIKRVQNMGAGVWYIPYIQTEDQVRKATDTDYQIWCRVCGSSVQRSSSVGLIVFERSHAETDCNAL